MAYKTLLGSGNRTIVWSVSGAAADTELLQFDKNVSSNSTGRQSLGNFVIDLDSKLLTPALETHYDTYLKKWNASPIETTYEDFSIDSEIPTPSNVSRLIFITVGAALAASNARRWSFYTGSYSGDTGNVGLTGGVADTPIQIAAFKTGAALTIASTKIWAATSDITDLNTFTADITIAADTQGHVAWYEQDTGAAVTT